MNTETAAADMFGAHSKFPSAMVREDRMNAATTDRMRRAYEAQFEAITGNFNDAQWAAYNDYKRSLGGKF